MIKSIYLAGNTPDGFKSYFNDVLKDKYVYVIKGGSGVGKSTLMKKVLAMTGQEENALIVPCSSDAKSLDMLVLEERNIALVDGTSPHACDPEAYGVTGEIIDLGKYINKSRIKENTKEIIANTRQKSVYYQIMYSHLNRARKNFDNIVAMYKGKISSFHSVVDDIISSFIIDAEQAATAYKGYGEYFTENGYIADRAAAGNRKIVKIQCQCMYYAYDVLSTISANLKSKNIAHEQYYSALYPDMLMGVGLKDLYVTASDISGDKEYSLDEFIDADAVRSNLVHLIEERSAFSSAIARAGEYFIDARNCHQEIEGYYFNAMQFTKMEKDREKLLQKIFD